MATTKNKTTVRADSDRFFLKSLEALLLIGFVHLSYLIAFKIGWFSRQGYTEKNIQSYWDIAIYVSLAALAIFLLTDAFNMARKTIAEIIVTMFLCSIMINILTGAIAFFTRSFPIPRSVILQAALFDILLFIVIKILFVRIVRRMSKTKHLLVLAPSLEKEETVSKILMQKGYAEQLKFFVDPTVIDYRPYLQQVDRIYISGELNNELKNDIMTVCTAEDKSAYIVPEILEISIYRSALKKFYDIPVFKVEAMQLPVEKQIVKRFFDLFLGAFFFLISLPFIVLSALAILIFEGRPIFYGQERMTANGKIFKLYKLRTMVNDAEKDTGAIWSSVNDARITRTGKILRRYWLDELPQFWNVLKGDMSLVGPRPERSVLFEQFSEEITEFPYRLTIKAGVTGLAQVAGNYSTDPKLKIKYDMLYIKQCSVLYDLILILETIKRILIGALVRDEDVPDYKLLLRKTGIREQSIGTDEIEYVKDEI